jgi:hypothetical protein
MGFLHDLYMLMEESTPAMEAEDITGQVNNDTKDLLGDSNDQGDQNDGDISMDTNDILGTKGDSNGGKQENEDDTQENPDDENTEQGDQMDTDDNPDPNSTPDEPPADDPVENEMNEKEDPFSISRKKKLWKNYKALYETFDDAVDLISKYVPNISDADTIKTLDNIRDNLMESKDLAYQTLTTDYQTMSYPEMQKRYIGLNNIFDLCTRELQTYFDKYRQ